MSIATEIQRIKTAKGTIRDKLVELKLATATDNIDALATAVNGIANNGSINADIYEGSTYTIPAGYHDGTGTVHAMTDVEGDYERYKTQTKTATPTKSAQTLSPDTGYYALSAVTVNPIPTNYKDISNVTVAASDVLTGKVIIDKNGNETTGTMPNNGTITTKVLDATMGSGGEFSNTTYTIPKGYHSGSGVVKIDFYDHTVITPREKKTELVPIGGKLYSTITVAPIPDSYLVEKTEATADAAYILEGETAWVNGSKVTGTMENFGAISTTIDGLTKTSYSLGSNGFVANVTVKLDNSIENALKEI